MQQSTTLLTPHQTLAPAPRARTSVLQILTALLAPADALRAEEHRSRQQMYRTIELEQHQVLLRALPPR